MIRTLSTWLLVALVGGALLAGCGSSSSSSTSSGSTASAPASSAATTAATTGKTTGTTTGTTSIPAVSAAVASCKRAVQSAPTLSATTKSKLEGVCDKAAHGDVGAARKAAQEVCTEIINTSPLPEGPAKQQALAACKATAGK